MHVRDKEVVESAEANREHGGKTNKSQGSETKSFLDKSEESKKKKNTVGGRAVQKYSRPSKLVTATELQNRGVRAHNSANSSFPRQYNREGEEKMTRSRVQGTLRRVRGC